jgi:hypothetical protein
MDRKVLFDGLQNLKGYFTCALMVHGNLKWLNVYSSGNPYRNTPVIFQQYKGHSIIGGFLNRFRGSCSKLLL